MNLIVMRDKISCSRVSFFEKLVDLIECRHKGRCVGMKRDTSFLRFVLNKIIVLLTLNMMSVVIA